MYTFTSESINKMGVNADGTNTSMPTVFAIPLNAISIGLPKYTSNLSFGPLAKYTTFIYSVKADGSVSSHGCDATHTIYITGTVADPVGNQTQLNTIGLASTSKLPDAGAPVNTGWISLQYSGSFDLYNLHTWDHCEGTGCWCFFSTGGLSGWSNITISVKVDVSIDLISYCTSNPSNLYTDVCYNYLSDYIPKNSAPEIVSTALNSYCTNKYPGRGLDLFIGSTLDPKDLQMCACNMDTKYYDTFMTKIQDKFPSVSFGSLRSNCLLPACATSNFKGTDLSNCPVPQCLEIINLTDDNITAGNVTFNQSESCSQSNGTPGPSKTPMPTTSPTPSPSWWKVHETAIIVGSVIIIIIIIFIVIIAYFGFRSDDISQT